MIHALLPLKTLCGSNRIGEEVRIFEVIVLGITLAVLFLLVFSIVTPSPGERRRK